MKSETCYLLMRLGVENPPWRLKRVSPATTKIVEKKTRWPANLKWIDDFLQPFFGDAAKEAWDCWNDETMWGKDLVRPLIFGLQTSLTQYSHVSFTFSKHSDNLFIYSRFVEFQNWQKLKVILDKKRKNVYWWKYFSSKFCNNTKKNE